MTVLPPVLARSARIRRIPASWAWAGPWTWGVALWIVGLASSVLGLGLYLALRDAGHPAPAFLDNAVNALLLPAVGLLVIVRRPRLPLGWVLYGSGVLLGVAFSLQEYGAWTLAHPGWPGAVWAVWVGGWLWIPGYVLAGCSTLLLPAGRPEGRAARAAWLVVLAATAVLCVVAALTPDEIQPGAPNPMPVPTGTGLALLTAGYVAVAVILPAASILGAVLVTRRRRHTTGHERRACTWLAVAAWMPTLGPLVGLVPAFGEAGTIGLPAYAMILAATMLRFDVLGTDTTVGRTVVWVALTGCVLSGYVVLVALLSTAARDAAGVSIALAASGVVALAIAPVRGRLQRAVDRMVHGGRADPYATAAGLSRRLAAGVGVDEVLTTIAATIVAELRLPYAAVELADGTVIEHGAAGAEVLRQPVVYLGEHVADLVVGARPGGLRRPERRLLADLADSSAAAVHGVRVVRALRASRARLVRAAEDERARLRRELHDDLGATLAGAAYAMDAVRNELSAGSREAERVTAVREALGTALDDLRRVIDGLRPPALDELGLAGALEARLRELACGAAWLRVESDELGSLPAAVEVAAYHIAVEAAGNAMRHAQASEVVVRLSRPDAVVVEVVDDGHGTPQVRPGGHGLGSMRERAEQLGGSLTVSAAGAGTSVRAVLPL